MSAVTLSAKAYNNSQLALVDKLLKSMFKGLKVETEINGTSESGQVQITVSGEDENAALRYLDVQIGLCPVLLENLERFSTVKGYIKTFNERELHVDIGVLSPRIFDAVIPLQRLEAQLVDGRRMALGKIAQLFGLLENLPLWVKALSFSEEESYVEAMLSERQLNLYESWVESLLDRLVVLGASFNDVTRALKWTKCSRDVVEIESLGLFEHAIVCKLDTKARGLIPKIGKKLRRAHMSVFDPTEILRLLGYYRGVQIELA